jgi:hypothetical protein
LRYPYSLLPVAEITVASRPDSSDLVRIQTPPNFPPARQQIHALKFSHETLDSFLKKATTAQIFSSGTGGLSAPKLGIPVILCRS